MAKRIMIVIVLLLLLIQLLRPQKNIASQPAGPDDFIIKFAPPATVRQVLQNACYDCHSNTTRYPWYANVQPVGWWLANHIDEGKDDLNLSEFGSYPLKKQVRKLTAISDQLSDREMPLRSYTWIHRDARLTDEQVRQVTDWIDGLHDKLAPDE